MHFLELALSIKGKKFIERKFLSLITFLIVASIVATPWPQRPILSFYLIFISALVPFNCNNVFKLSIWIAP